MAKRPGQENEVVRAQSAKRTGKETQRVRVENGRLEEQDDAGQIRKERTRRSVVLGLQTDELRSLKVKGGVGKELAREGRAEFPRGTESLFLAEQTTAQQFESARV